MTALICIPILLGLAWGVARLAQDHIVWCSWGNDNRMRRARGRAEARKRRIR